LDFLPVIENTELEILIGEWVIDAALKQLSKWQNDEHFLEVSINISASHLQSKGFINALEAKLALHPDLRFGCLEIEVLETAALQDLAKATTIIKECKDKGVSFALDDFGTGYSSLTYLRSIPAETLKIDQTFVRDMLEDQGDRAIVDGIIVLAKAFDLKVVAEGVETTEHYRALVKMGCQIGQGYGIARPMPVAKFMEWYQSLSDTVQPTFAR
jgi:EAL domain-containing protein (putative c-di-GMP-specific phosphodiesterase class I)